MYTIDYFFCCCCSKIRVYATINLNFIQFGHIVIEFKMFRSPDLKASFLKAFLDILSSLK